MPAGISNIIFPPDVTGSNTPDKAPEKKISKILTVTITTVNRTNHWAFTKENFDKVKPLYSDFIPVNLECVDNRTSKQNGDISGIYPTIWNTTLQQIESRDLAMAFYLDGLIPKTRGAKSHLTNFFIEHGASFNPNTGFYELNGILNISEKEINTIYLNTKDFLSKDDCSYEFYDSRDFRTNFTYYHNRINVLQSRIFNFSSLLQNSYIEVLLLSEHEDITCNNLSNFATCNGINKIIGVLKVYNTIGIEKAFYDAYNLDCKLYGLNKNCSFGYQPKIETILFALQNRRNTQIITIEAQACPEFLNDPRIIQALLPVGNYKEVILTT